MIIKGDMQKDGRSWQKEKKGKGRETFSREWRRKGKKKKPAGHFLPRGGKNREEVIYSIGGTLLVVLKGFHKEKKGDGIDGAFSVGFWGQDWWATRLRVGKKKP